MMDDVGQTLHDLPASSGSHSNRDLSADCTQQQMARFWHRYLLTGSPFLNDRKILASDAQCTHLHLSHPDDDSLAATQVRGAA